MQTRSTGSSGSFTTVVQGSSSSFAYHVSSVPQQGVNCDSPARGPARTFARYEELPRVVLPLHYAAGTFYENAKTPTNLSLRPTLVDAAHSALSLQPAGPTSPLEEEAPEFSEPSCDLEGLLRYLDSLKQDRIQITELTYCVNIWFMANVIPVRHYGFILKAGDNGYLTLDFSQRGILWDTFDEYPDFPDRTIFAKRYKIDVDPIKLRTYCEETEPFSWFENDCFNWAQGLMRVVKIKEDPLTDTDSFLFDVQGITMCGVQALSPLRLISCCS